jgi:hypothetical protein
MAIVRGRSRVARYHTYTILSRRDSKKDELIRITYHTHVGALRLVRNIKMMKGHLGWSGISISVVRTEIGLSAATPQRQSIHRLHPSRLLFHASLQLLFSPLRNHTWATLASHRFSPLRLLYFIFIFIFLFFFRCLCVFLFPFSPCSSILHPQATRTA